MRQAPPRLEIAISVLADGRVVFCDLPPDLAEVRDVLAGESASAETASNGGASEPVSAATAVTATGESPA
jgi:hypothetical protein